MWESEYHLSPALSKIKLVFIAIQKQTISYSNNTIIKHILKNTEIPAEVVSDEMNKIERK